MAIQETVAATTINPGRMPSDQIISEFTKTKSVIPLAARAELDSLASVHENKARKPYTITKQREKWTEEEHMKFRDALKLYGRAWRKIEEHIGTKTTVQIRSHAQKFFSKIAREPRNVNFDSGEVIEIPPPRPKRKPTHPYPRKFVGRVVSSVMSSSSSPLTLKFEQEKGSSTSVLSAAGSDTIDSTISGPKSGHISSDLSAAVSSSPSMVALEQENSYKSSIEVDGGIPSPDMVSLCSCPIDKFDLELDSAVKDKNVSMEGSSLTSLKLFGSTFVVAHPQKDTSMFDGNPILFQKKSTLTLFEELGNEKQEKQMSQPTLEMKQTMLQADSLLDSNHHDDNEETVRNTLDVQNSSEEFDSVLHPTLSPQCSHYRLANMVSSPCEVRKIAPNICGNAPRMMVLCKNELSKGGCNSNDIEVVDALQKGDDLVSESVQSPVYKEKTAVSRWKVSVNSAFSKPMKLGVAQRGFLPYKRCKIEGDYQPSQSGNEIRQSAKFCL